MPHTRHYSHRDVACELPPAPPGQGGPPPPPPPPPPPTTRTNYGDSQPFPPPIAYCELGATLEQSHACATWICWNGTGIFVQMDFADCAANTRTAYSYQQWNGCIPSDPADWGPPPATWCDSCPHGPPPCP